MQRSFFFVAHIPREHLAILAQSGIIRVQVESWEKSNLSKVPLKSLLCEVSGSSLGSSRMRNQYNKGNYVLCTQNGRNLLSNYFQCLTEWAAGAIHGRYEDRKSRSTYLVLNLMPFDLRSAAPDKIFAGLEAGFSAKKSKLKHVNLIILTRSSNAIQRSKRFKSFVDNYKTDLRVTLVDYRGFYRRGLSNDTMSLPREMFRNILCGEDEDAFYKKLIFGTNSHIGHFVLNESHVRTHYDLEDFLRKDSVKERIYACLLDELNSRFAGLDNLLIVYAGIERAALMRFSHFVRDFCGAVSFPIDAGDLEEWSHEVDNAEFILVLTDILNTTNSVTRVYNDILNCRSGKARKDVFVFSIIRMANTPDPSEALDYRWAVKIKRDFYRTSDKSCPLCELDQPRQPVKIVKDFKIVGSEQMTPFDFWEIVSDSRALRIKEEDPRGRILDFRVDSLRVMDRYSKWIQNLISAKYAKHFNDQLPSVVLTVDEETGKRFARLVASALKLEHSVIRHVSRQSLHPYQTSGYIDNNDLTNYRGEKVLIVDDGMNSGETIRHLGAFTKRVQAQILAVLVFDNRVSPNDMVALRTVLNYSPILSLYEWPVQPLEYRAPVA